MYPLSPFPSPSPLYPLSPPSKLCGLEVVIKQLTYKILVSIIIFDYTKTICPAQNALQPYNKKNNNIYKDLPYAW